MNAHVEGPHEAATSAEHHRLYGDRRKWLRWGPYLSERAWGTVREDYSVDGQAWEYFPHDHARSRAYRWSEDGLGGICDQQQTICIAFAFWNGRDPILKERIFGLSGNEGNHGEDAKELWWYLDSTPTHSWMRWRYVYPIAEFPYLDLVQTNGARSRLDAEYELLDTGVLDGGYWDITADYAKADHDDICIRLTVRNVSDQTATLQALPTVWCRNTWSWDAGAERPILKAEPARGQAADPAGMTVSIEHPIVGHWSVTSSGEPTLLFCDNETNAARISAEGTDNTGGSVYDNVADGIYPKDAINDHVVNGLDTCNPESQGTKAAFWHTLTVGAGDSAVVCIRLAPTPRTSEHSVINEILATRAQEAQEYYATLSANTTSDDERLVMRQAFGGLLWSKQFYHFDVERWLDGDPGAPPPPAERKLGRNSGWRHLNNADVISMPDKWEYPWYAAWDLGFHCVALAHVDPVFAKQQLLLLCREWYQHPNGQLPAYEWSFGDVNPPVHAWAALRVFEIDGGTDHDFLERIFHKLLLNFTWWVNRKDEEGNNVFEGGFLGLDNIGPLDRSALPVQDGHLEQADGTAWMGMYCLNLLDIALVLAQQDDTYEDLATKFFEHFSYIAKAIHDSGLWNDEDGFFYDSLHHRDDTREPIRVRSIVGLLPLAAATIVTDSTFAALPDFAARFAWFRKNRAEYSNYITASTPGVTEPSQLLAMVDPDQLVRLLTRMFAQDEFLSPFGIRALSAEHREHPFSIEVSGVVSRVDYEPGESTSPLFGGNSNWRGPIWFPVNFILIESLRRYQRFLGDQFTIEFPTGTGRLMTLHDIADELDHRLVSIFLDDTDRRRPVFGSVEKLQSDPNLHDLIPFHEYFHGDTGAGLGAAHQTGWTALVGAILAKRQGGLRSD